MSATWTKSTTARVKGYSSRSTSATGWSRPSRCRPTATSWSATIDKYYVTAYSIQYSVTTITDYGWIKESDEDRRLPVLTRAPDRTPAHTAHTQRHE